MVGHEKEGCADKFLDDLYKTIKYLYEHRKELDCPVEEMVKTAEELERKSKCTRQVCEEMAGLSAREDLELDHMREFYKKRLAPYCSTIKTWQKALLLEHWIRLSLLKEQARICQ